MNAATHPQHLVPDAMALVRLLQSLRSDVAQPPLQAQRLASALRLLCRARSALLLQPGDHTNTTANADAGWTVLAQDHHDGRSGEALDAGWRASLADLAPRLAPKGFAVCPATTAQGESVLRLAVALVRAAPALAVLELPQSERGALNELILRAQLVADLPLAPEPAPAATPTPAAAGAIPADAAATPSNPSDLAGPAPDIMALVAAVVHQTDFDTAAMTLANGLAATGSGLQVAVGWADAGNLRLVAMSHLERFERRSPPVELLEDAMADSLAQEAWSHWPGAAAPAAHGRLAQALGLQQVHALVVRHAADGPGMLLLVLQTENSGWHAALQAPLQAALPLALPPLTALRQQQRGWLLRWQQRCHAGLQRLLGPRHAWLKAAAAACTLFVAYALLFSWTYRVHGDAQLTTDSTRLLAASFDGRVESVSASSGDLVKAGSLLATLDTRDLRQQEMDTQAELRRTTAEGDKARAAAAWADVEIAGARQQQAEAKLARLRAMLEQAQQRAPFDGVVVEGERKDLLGAPVRKGDKLFKLARIEGLYAVLTVPERDIPEVLVGATGELALVTRPDLKIPLRVTSVIPMAQTKGQEGNQFVIRAALQMPAQAWWRPGMSGSVRIDAGERPVAWILSHRLVDKLRLWLWW